MATQFHQQLTAIEGQTDDLRAGVAELLAEAAEALPPAIDLETPSSANTSDTTAGTLIDASTTPELSRDEIIAVSTEYAEFFHRNETRIALLQERLTRVQLDLDALELPRCEDGVTADPAYREVRRAAIRNSERLIGDIQHLKTTVLQQARIAFPSSQSPPTQRRGVKFADEVTAYQYCDTTPAATTSSSSSSSSSSAPSSSSSYSYTFGGESREIVAVSEAVDLPVDGKPTTANDGSIASQLGFIEADIVKLTESLNNQLQLGDMEAVDSLLRQIDSLNTVKELLLTQG